MTTNDNHATYPLTITDIEDIKSRALIDAGAGASYVSSTLVDRIIKKQFKRVEIILNSAIKPIPVYSVEIRDLAN